MSHAPQDRVDAIIDHLAERRPDLDLSVPAVHIRIQRLSHWLETEARRRLAPKGLEFWELSLLSAIVRAGGSRTVGELQDHAQLTSGAITHRVAKLEGSGAVVRRFSEQDRRQVNVEITTAGRARLETIIDTVSEAEGELFGAVDPALLAQLAENLRAVMLATEGSV